MTLSTRRFTSADLPAAPPGTTAWPWTDGEGPAPAETEVGPVDELPRVSIVTPSYNQGEYIEETIRSVLLQGYPELEYIVIDGGSTDHTVEILRRYEPWLAHWSSEPDDGQSQAINRGFQRASGEIVAWLNSDDNFAQGAIWRAVTSFRENPDAAVIYGRTAVCDEQGKPTGRIQGRPFDLDELIRGRCPVPQPSAFFRKNVLDRVGWLDESLHYVMDWELWLRLGSSAPVVFVDEVWSNFRYYPESKSGMGRLPFTEEIHRVLERAFSSQTLPPRLQEQRRSVLAHSHARIAAGNYSLARDRVGRRHALKALRHDAAILKEHRWRGKLLRCLIGRRWVRRLARSGEGAR